MIPMPYYRGLVVLIALLLTGIAAYNKISVYRIAVRSSEALLKSKSAFIWISLADALREPSVDANILHAVANSHPDAQVAYLALIDSKGTIVLHTDNRLIGAAASDELNMGVTERPQREPNTGLHTLADGTVAYIMDMGVEIRWMNGNPHLLRVALHPSPAFVDVRRATRHIILSMSLILFIYLLAWLFFYYSKRIDDMQRKSLEKEHLATLGEMAAVVAHEIRGPLSAIKGFSQYLTETGILEPAREEGCRIITSEAIRLEHLTEDLLSYARVDNVQPVGFSLLELVDEVWSLMASSKHTIVIKKEISENDDWAYTDRDKLRRVLMNVIQNSLESIEEKGSININVRKDKGKLTLSIGDTGRGMDAGTAKDAFKPFFTKKVKGTGLGLAIVEKIIKSLNGTVRIASQLGVGTVVTIVLPVHENG